MSCSNPYQKPLNYESFYLLPTAVNGTAQMQRCHQRRTSASGIPSRKQLKLSAEAREFIPKNLKRRNSWTSNVHQQLSMPAYAPPLRRASSSRRASERSYFDGQHALGSLAGVL
eukprot:CAMPEP_0167797244 /NCGR_PEP_ID=MMETSP0111_2-20121227/15531_1 /TAXON_ID=91324 /ORGANISM="Lotharella globosa, Strain CCCM811" /LENGTH=113 /DNA_ID=CAMNT_0007691297 /DNA_START=57 /DNA_END=398 /DNA_ORIENTATION=-